MVIKLSPKFSFQNVCIFLNKSKNHESFRFSTPKWTKNPYFRLTYTSEKYSAKMVPTCQQSSYFSSQFYSTCWTYTDNKFRNICIDSASPRYSVFISLITFLIDHFFYLLFSQISTEMSVRYGMLLVFDIENARNGVMKSNWCPTKQIKCKHDYFRKIKIVIAEEWRLVEFIGSNRSKIIDA